MGWNCKVSSISCHPDLSFLPTASSCHAGTGQEVPGLGGGEGRGDEDGVHSHDGKESGRGGW